MQFSQAMPTSQLTVFVALVFVSQSLNLEHVDQQCRSRSQCSAALDAQRATSILQFRQESKRREHGLISQSANVEKSNSTLSTRAESDGLILFPLVQSMHTEGECCADLAPDVMVELLYETSRAPPASEILRRALARTQTKLRNLAHSRTNKHGRKHWPVARIRVQVPEAAGHETLDETTNYHYAMNCSAAAGDCTIAAESAFAAISALESTLLQVFAAGSAPFQILRIKDWPEYQVRGLMIDVGRRFVPKGVILEQVINGMALVRMNLLQLHLSDFCRFALALPSFPELTRNGLLDGQYSVDDVREIVAYARERGIRVVPEVDLPGHASGLLPLKARGLQFCESTKGGETLPEEAAKVFDDPDGQSRRVLHQLLEETAAAFGNESWFHVGGDEVKPSGRCTEANVIRLEEFVSRDIVGGTLGRTSVAWGEVLLKQKVLDGERAAGDTNKTILVTWQGGGEVREVLQRGHRVIAASMGHHYLDTDSGDRPASNFWYDLKAEYGIRPPEQVGLLGGISAMWTDRYCYAYQCEAAGVDIARRLGSRGIPVVPTMFTRDHDAVFAQSFAGMIWPRAGVTAAALWRYSSDVSHAELEQLSDWLAEVLRAIGHVATCPPGCHCDEASSCGQAYVTGMPDKTRYLSLMQNPGDEEDQVIHKCFSRVLNGSGKLKLTPRKRDELHRCFWRGRACSGVGIWMKKTSDAFCWPPLSIKNDTLSEMQNLIQDSTHKITHNVAPSVTLDTAEKSSHNANYGDITKTAAKAILNTVDVAARGATQIATQSATHTSQM